MADRGEPDTGGDRRDARVVPYAATWGVRRPLAGLAICYVCGTWCGFRFSLSLPFLLCFGVFWLFVALCLLLVGERRRSSFLSLLQHIVLYSCVVLLAWFSAGVSQIRDIDSAGVPGEISPVHFRGLVASDPVAGLLRERGTRQWQFAFRVEEVQRGVEKWEPVSGTVKVLWYAPDYIESPEYGERWEMNGDLRSPRHKGELRRGAAAIFMVDNRDAQLLSGGHGLRIMCRIFRGRGRAAASLTRGIEEFTAETGILQALILGYRSRLTEESSDLFALTGTLHIFAISGLHVGILCSLIMVILKSLRVTRVYWIIFLGPLLVAYTVGTGAKPSAIRACIMACAYFLAPLSKRKPDVISALAFAALAVLVFSPNQLFEVGFIFSFVVVMGLIVFYPIFNDPMRRWLAKDALRIQPEKWWILMRRRALQYVGSLLALSCSAWLASAPLTAYFFGRFTPIALPGNILVIPLAFLIVVAGCLSIILGACAGWVGVVFNHASLALVSILVWGIEMMSKVPFASVNVEKPPMWLVLAWYAVLIAFAVRAVRRGFGPRRVSNERH